MDPITLATITSAVTHLGIESAKAATPEVAKLCWAKVKEVLGWTEDIPSGSLSERLAVEFTAHPDRAAKIASILQLHDVGESSQMASSIKVEQGTVVLVTRNTGSISQTLNFGTKPNV